MPMALNLTIRKRRLFQAAMLVAAYLLLELASLALLTWRGGDLAGQRTAAAQRDPAAPGGALKRSVMIHPYIGLVYQPREPAGTETGGQLRFNEYGFLDARAPLRKRSPERLIVALMGGSVARQLGTNATDQLARELELISPFQGRSIEFVRLAIDGNKQPQQVMTLNYLLALGAEFDLVINLDGVNEIALPGIDNVPLGVSAAYPRKWSAMTAAAASPEMASLAGSVTYLRTVQRDAARWFDAPPWRHSPTATLVWAARHARLDRQIIEQMQRLLDRSQEELSYCSAGPPETYASDAELLAHCAQVWERSSLLLHQLCQANGIRYFHFLQPNQHLPDSKPMGRSEAATALNDASPFARPVREGYPLLQAKGQRLVEQGVAFADLTRIFSEHPEPIYRDDCCHVNQAGDEILATQIAARIKRWCDE
ncbi:MAG: hypothetical protein ACKV0T_19585 [Planctomycetales bacterium]